MDKVSVRLAATCIVDRETREKGEIVEMDADLAPAFGEVLKPGKPGKVRSPEAAEAPEPETEE